MADFLIEGPACAGRRAARARLRGLVLAAASAAVAVAAAGAVAGCGSSQPAATRPAAGTATGRSSQPAGATRPAAGTPTGAAAHPPAGVPAPTGSGNAREFAGRAGAARFRVLVGEVCLAVRAQAPSALGPGASDAAVRRHAAAAAASTRRTLESFGRLQAPTTALAQLRPLSADYERLATLYAGALGTGAAPGRAFLAAIRLGEERAAATARTAGFPACGPATAATRPAR